MKCKECGNEFPSRFYMKTDTICVACFAKMNPDRQKKDIYESLMPHPMTSTTFSIDGYEVKKQLGVVRGITVRSRSIFGTLGATLQTVIGGNITMFTELCERSRGEAFEMMVEHSKAVGANAVIGVRYDATEVMDGVTEVLCYGTAVIVEQIAG